MKVKVSTVTKFLMSMGVYIAVYAFMELFRRNLDGGFGEMLMILGFAAIFAGIGVFIGIRTFTWDIFKNHVLLRPGTAVWFVCAGALAVAVCLS